MKWDIIGKIILFMMLPTVALPVPIRFSGTEKEVLHLISTPQFTTSHPSDRCHNMAKYVVYLIDNFNQTVDLLPELQTSHGELLLKILMSGRYNIDVKVLNTPLGMGLARVIKNLNDGACIDAVVSSIPGSNYTYDQISSLLEYKARVDADTILDHRNKLVKLLERIAFRGFPSFEWLRQIDVNSVKLKSDATVVAFIDVLNTFDVPIFLPYGNADAYYKGQLRTVNILSLTPNAKVYSALDQHGNRIPGFPYSPLSSGDERAVFDLRECPDPKNPFEVRLDVNDDGYYDYTYRRTGGIAYVGKKGQTLFAPPLVTTEAFLNLKAWNERNGSCKISEELVLTAEQFRQLREGCETYREVDIKTGYVWLNSKVYETPFYFNATCRIRGHISGTSFIPPHKVKEFLP